MTHDLVREHVRQMVELSAHFERVEKLAVLCDRPPNLNDMTPLSAYSGRDWVLCKYLRPEDEQAAYNAVVSALPSTFKPPRCLADFKAIGFIMLQPGPHIGDPLDCDGYIGAKWGENLQ